MIRLLHRSNFAVYIKKNQDSNAQKLFIASELKEVIYFNKRKNKDTHVYHARHETRSVILIVSQVSILLTSKETKTWTLELSGVAPLSVASTVRMIVPCCDLRKTFSYSKDFTTVNVPFSESMLERVYPVWGKKKILKIKVRRTFTQMN